MANMLFETINAAGLLAILVFLIFLIPFIAGIGIWLLLKLTHQIRDVWRDLKRGY